MVLLLAKKNKTKKFRTFICDMQIQDISCHKKKEKPKVCGLRIRFIPRYIIYFSTLCKKSKLNLLFSYIRVKNLTFYTEILTWKVDLHIF